MSHHSDRWWAGNRGVRLDRQMPPNRYSPHSWPSQRCVLRASASDRCPVDSLIKPNELSVQLRREPAGSHAFWGTLPHFDMRTVGNTSDYCTNLSNICYCILLERVIKRSFQQVDPKHSDEIITLCDSWWVWSDMSFYTVFTFTTFTISE